MLSRLKEVAQNALLAINAAQADVEEFAYGVTQTFRTNSGHGSLRQTRGRLLCMCWL